jgi:hypothetical protein
MYVGLLLSLIIMLFIVLLLLLVLPQKRKRGIPINMVLFLVFISCSTWLALWLIRVGHVFMVATT